MNNNRFLLVDRLLAYPKAMFRGLPIIYLHKEEEEQGKLLSIENIFLRSFCPLFTRG
jgi:hypothetical protein